jgi:hypothetical protein
VPEINSQFLELLDHYDRIETELARLKDETTKMDNQKRHVRKLLTEEVQRMGLGRGSKLDIPGKGTFHFTTKRFPKLPAERREDFVDLIIARGETSLLTIGKSDLAAWCTDLRRADIPLPPYITLHEDKFVPVISLDSAKARREAKARTRTRSKNDG